jgi:uncharacterized damage-inducible protein DinB
MMFRNALATLLLAFLFFWVNSPASLAQRGENFPREFLPLWERATAYTLEVAEAMPAERYQYRPSEGMFTFADQMVHIVKNLYWLNSAYIKAETSPIKDDPLENKSKEEIIKLLRDAFKYVADAAKNTTDRDVKNPVRFADEVVNKERIFYLMRDHMTHHRGQCIVYLRLNGLQPPRYKGW